LSAEQGICLELTRWDCREAEPSIEFVEKGEHFHLYLEMEDASAAASVLKKNGVPLIKDVHETAWGTRE
jgi:hypothetical protein